MSFSSFALYGLIALASFPDSNVQELEVLVEQYNQAGEQQDATLLEGMLSTDFRVVLNDAEKGQAQVLDRATYLKLIENKTLGGAKRRLSLRSIDMSAELIATVEALQVGKDNTLHSYLSFVRPAGKWQLVQTLVILE